jgi:hypothetical protein
MTRMHAFVDASCYVIMFCLPSTVQLSIQCVQFILLAHQILLTVAQDFFLPLIVCRLAWLAELDCEAKHSFSQLRSQFASHKRILKKKIDEHN